jgi:crotonobetainyl-CoA:carnitine CoA-transferase CaiB-like acyl-CoA transferase
VGPSIGDQVPGIFCAFGILAAVHHARRTGRGQYVDVALADSTLAISERIIHQLSIEGTVAVPQGNHHPTMCPYGAFPAKDGWVTIACPTDDFWLRLCGLLEAHELLTDSRYKDKESRRINQLSLQADLARLTAKFTKASLTERLGGHVPYAPVLNSAEIMDHPHFRAREMIVSMDYGLAEPIATVGIPVRLSETPGRVMRRAPTLGEHTDEVLTSHGYSDEQIRQLRETAIVK